jgi:hypothetical protein
VNEVIGAQIVSVPAKLADISAENAFRIILLWLGGIFALVFVAANVLVLLFAGRFPSKVEPKNPRVAGM